MIIPHREAAPLGRKLHNPNYLFEREYDGERTIAFVENGKIVRLQNRRQRDYLLSVGETLSNSCAINRAGHRQTKAVRFTK